jgi:hypothetical protein
MSNADEMQLSYAEESAFGTAPTGAYEVLRYTSESLAAVTRSEPSNEIRSDRQVVDLVRLGLNVAGEVNFELSYGGQDAWLAYALESAAWSAGESITGGTFSVNGTTGTITHDASGGGFANTVAGEWITCSGFAQGANNTVFKVLSVTDDDNIVVAGAAAMVTESTASATIERMPQIVNGVTANSVTGEKYISDVASEFVLEKGLMVDSLRLAGEAGAKITGTFGCLGKIEESASSSPGSGYNAAATAAVMNAVDHVTGILEGVPAVNQANTFSAMAFEINLLNNLRQREEIGTLGPTSIGEGKCAVTGTLRAYFTSKTIMDKYRNWTASALAILMLDAAGNRYVVDLPEIRYGDGKQVAGGENTDIIADLSFQAIRDSGEDATIRIARLAA